MATGGDPTKGRAPAEEQQRQAPGAPAAGTTAAPAGKRRGRSEPSPNMLPGRERRRTVAERFLVRLIATGGVVGIGVALGAILHSSGEKGWIIGLVVSIVSVILSAILWSSRQL